MEQHEYSIQSVCIANDRRYRVEIRVVEYLKTGRGMLGDEMSNLKGKHEQLR